MLTIGIAALATPALAEPVIVLVGGMKAEMPDGEHDFPGTIIKIERLIKASPAFQRLGAKVRTYPIGFPKNLSEIDDASVVVLYLGPNHDGSPAQSPLADPAVRREMDKLMANGVGLVALHQSFTASGKNSVEPLAQWLGAIREPGSSSSTERAPVTVRTATHPVARGISRFDLLDEYYTAINFGRARITPVLSAQVHVPAGGTVARSKEQSRDQVIAWSLTREGGGRSFGFSVGHYLSFLDQASPRIAVLNGILWAAKQEVPSEGARSDLPLSRPGGLAPLPEPQRIVLPASEVKPEPQPWGKLEWFASRALGNSSKMTTGQATISPGKANPPHWHPNCDEVLHVLQGHIMNRVGDKEFEMKAGDTAVIPEGTIHNARNIGTEDAVLAISFNSADRTTIGE